MVTIPILREKNIIKNLLVEKKMSRIRRPVAAVVLNLTYCIEYVNDIFNFNNNKSFALICYYYDFL